MTILFSALTVLALLLVAILAQTTGMAATNYFVLMFVLGVYLLWSGRKQYAAIKLKQGE